MGSEWVALRWNDRYGGCVQEPEDEGEKEGSSGVDLAAARWLAGVLGSTLVGAHELETWRLASEDDAAACTRLG